MPSRLDPDKIKALIKERGFPSVAAFGRHIGLSESSLGRLFKKTEQHNFTHQTISMIADGLGVHPFELYKQEAIDEGVAVATAEAFAGAVVDAITEAVTAVTAEAPPDATPQEVADAVPNEIPLTVPPALDLKAYFDYIKQTHAEEITSLRSSYEERIAETAHHHKMAMRTLYVIVGVLAAIIVFLLLK